MINFELFFLTKNWIEICMFFYGSDFTSGWNFFFCSFLEDFKTLKRHFEINWALSRNHLTFILLSGTLSHTFAMEILTENTSFNQSQDSRSVENECCDFISERIRFWTRFSKTLKQSQLNWADLPICTFHSWIVSAS